MTTPSQLVSEQIAYRVAIILPRSKEILAESNGHSSALPAITIQRWSRVAEQITTNIKVRWNLQTVVVDSFAPSEDTPGLAILEALSCDDFAKSESLQPCHLTQICIDTRCRDLLQEILSETGKYRSSLLRLGWIDQAKKWLQENIRDREIQFDGDLRQLNAGGGFALVRFGVSSGPAYWIKAAGPPNRNELAITEMLSECSPESLPPLIAVHRAWNAWAMEEVGMALTDSIDVETLLLVSSRLARLQQQTMSYPKSFLDSGCGEQRTEILRGNLPVFFECVARLASNGAPENPAGDVDAILPRAEAALRGALDEICNLRIPDTINNNDMKLANILFDGKRCVFTDWCHAYWGNPFLTFQHLHTYLSRRLPDLAVPFQEAYSAAWTDFLSDVQIQRMLLLAPVVAPYAYICGGGPASLVSRAGDSSLEKLFLGIVRRIAAAGDCLCGKEQQAYV